MQCIDRLNPILRQFVSDAILDYFLSVLYFACQALSFDTHNEDTKKKYVIRHFVMTAILDFFFYSVLYSNDQVFLFDTHKGL